MDRTRRLWRPTASLPRATAAGWRLWPFGEDGLLAMNNVAKMAGNEVGEEN